MARKQSKALMTTYIKTKPNGFKVRLVDKRLRPVSEVNCTGRKILETVICARDKIGVAQMSEEKESYSEVLVENPGPSKTEALMEALEKNGMRRSSCEKDGCGRVFLTRRERETPDLCPPCAGLAPPKK